VARAFDLVATQGELVSGAVDALVTMLDDPTRRARCTDEIAKASARIREIRHDVQRLLLDTHSAARTGALRLLVDDLAMLIRPISRAARYVAATGGSRAPTDASDRARIVAAVVLDAFSAVGALAHLDRLSAPLAETGRVRHVLAEFPATPCAPATPGDPGVLAAWIAQRAVVDALAEVARSCSDTLARVDAIVADFSLSQP
jgi:hypothetical protein